MAEKPAAPSTPGTPPLVAMPAELVAELLGMIKAKASVDPSPTMERLLLALESQSTATKRLGDEFSRTVRRSNAASPNLSVFTFDKRCEYCKTKTPHPVHDAAGAIVVGAVGPLAHPKPKLMHLVYVCGSKQVEEALTPIEIELFNSFAKSVTAKAGRWTAMLRRDGNRSILSIDFPARTLDELQDLPRSLAEVLTELLFGEEATDALDLIGEVMRLKQRLAAFEAQTNTTSTHARTVPASGGQLVDPDHTPGSAAAGMDVGA